LEEAVATVDGGGARFKQDRVGECDRGKPNGVAGEDRLIGAGLHYGQRVGDGSRGSAQDQRGAVVAQAAVSLTDEEGGLDVLAADDELGEAGSVRADRRRSQPNPGDVLLLGEGSRAGAGGPQVNGGGEAVREGE